jgi:hypothetical protein
VGQLVLRILELDNPLLLRETEAGDEKVRTYFDDSIGRNSSDCNPQRMRKLGKLEWEWDQLGGARVGMWPAQEARVGMELPPAPRHQLASPRLHLVRTVESCQKWMGSRST